MSNLERLLQQVQSMSSDLTHAQSRLKDLQQQISEEISSNGQRRVQDAYHSESPHTRYDTQHGVLAGMVHVAYRKRSQEDFLFSVAHANELRWDALDHAVRCQSVLKMVPPSIGFRAHEPSFLLLKTEPFKDPNPEVAITPKQFTSASHRKAVDDFKRQFNIAALSWNVVQDVNEIWASIRPNSGYSLYGPKPQPGVVPPPHGQFSQGYRTRNETPLPFRGSLTQGKVEYYYRLEVSEFDSTQASFTFISSSEKGGTNDYQISKDYLTVSITGYPSIQFMIELDSKAMSLWEEEYNTLVSKELKALLTFENGTLLTFEHFIVLKFMKAHGIKNGGSQWVKSLAFGERPS